MCDNYIVTDESFNFFKREKLVSNHTVSRYPPEGYVKIHKKNLKNHTQELTELVQRVQIL